MDAVQVVLVGFGLLVTAGGVVSLLRSAGRGDSARSGYLPLAMIVVGLVIAYRSYSDYGLMDAQDITIMFLFVLGLGGLLGLQFFIVDKNKKSIEAPGSGGPREGEER